MLRALIFAVASIGAVFVPMVTSRAGPIVPVGLNPGDPYQLIFVTAGSLTAASSDIADYNQFVNSQAALNPLQTGTNIGVEWFAVASTSTVDARDNAVLGATVPVYLVNGVTKVADGFDDLWDGTIDAAITLDQFGSPIGLFDRVWSGTNIDGTASLFPLGLGPSANTGLPIVTFTAWVFDGFSFPSNNNKRLYALSETLVVPSTGPSIPEPGSGSLLLIGCCCTAFACLYRRRRQAALIRN